MEENILIGYETFSEFPDKDLKINTKSNLFYVKVDDRKFIARDFLNSALSDGDNVKFKMDYKDVINGDTILSIVSSYNLSNPTIIISNKNKKIQIVQLGSILNLDESASSYFSLDDVKALVNFESPTLRQPRKYYF